MDDDIRSHGLAHPCGAVRATGPSAVALSLVHANVTTQIQQPLDVEHGEPHPVDPADKPTGRNLFLIAVIAAIPVSLLLGFLAGKEGELAGSGLALVVVSSAVAFAILYALIVVVRAAAHHKAVGLGIFGGRIDPPDDARGSDTAQHEALVSQAKATEKVVEATTEQLTHDKELLKAEKERADRERDRADRELARADDLQRQLDARRFARDPLAPGPSGEEELRVRRTNPTHGERPPG